MVGLGSNPPEDAIYPLAFTDGVRRSYLGRLHVVLISRRVSRPPQRRSPFSHTVRKTRNLRRPGA